MIDNLKSLDLQKIIDCEVFTNDEILNFYSVDSSFYKIKPKIVVTPNHVSDIVKIVKFAKRHKISVTVRGGGTGLVGSALNNGIVLDLKKFDKIKVGKSFVTVDPGISKGMLDKTLNKHGKFLGPNPSVGPYCTIGGMIGTNASGSQSLKYGSIIDNLLEVTLVTGNGKIIKLPSKTKLADSILRLAKEVKDFPSVSKNSCGYRLDTVTNHANTHKIIAASEGTLGILISAKLKILKKPQKKILLIVGYHTIKTAVTDCQNIVKLDPCALEFIDNHTMKHFKTKFPKNIACLLFIEFDSNITKNITKFKKISNGQILFKLEHKKLINKWWAYRNSALHFSLTSLPANQIMPHIIEDAVVPINKLEDLFKITQKIRKKFHAKLVMYGHAGNGNIHIRVALSKNNKNTAYILAKEFFLEIICLGGTITGEHGDGIARTKFVKMQYGKKTYETFSKLKQKFDPHNILNPNKIVMN